MENKEYPRWACQECGEKHGAKPKMDRVSTWHYGQCDVCGGHKSVTEPRDYGHFPYWFQKN